MILRESKLNHKERQAGPVKPVSSPASGGEEGLFPPDSMIRQVNQEALELLGGGCAILLQLAHPAFAAGVAEYSYFQGDPLTRLWRTLEFMHILIFGSRQEAQAALRQFHAIHARIQGHLPHEAGRLPAGSAYTAQDPALKLWVYATLVESGLMTYQRFVRPMTLDERRRYYADTQLLARHMGIPAQMLPPTLEDFQVYMSDMLASDTLAVTETTRLLARDVLQPGNVSFLPAATARLVRFVTVGLLPERLRVAYGFAWGERHQRWLDRLSWTTRRLRPVMPAWVWQSPHLKGGLTRLLLEAAAK